MQIMHTILHLPVGGVFLLLSFFFALWPSSKGNQVIIVVTPTDKQRFYLNTKDYENTFSIPNCDTEINISW